MAMHPDEIPIDEPLVVRLLSAQFPRWADLPLRRVASTGTVNVVFRLGDDLLVRLPRTPRGHHVDREVSWIAALAPQLPLVLPEVLGLGDPDETYPCQWAVLRWIDGEIWRGDRVDDPCAAAEALAAFLRTLQQLDPATLPGPPRVGRLSLAEGDAEVRTMAEAARGMLDVDAFLAAWNDVLEVPGWDRAPLLLHGDMMAGNLLVRDGRLAAVIDWEGVRAGDPARDLMAAWTLFDGRARKAFREALPFDEATWERSRGWALTRIANVAYYAESNPLFAADAQATIAAVLGP